MLGDIGTRNKEERRGKTNSSDCVAAAEAALEILEASAAVSAFFAQEIEWLQDRLAIWRSRAWRVGVLGITSSGKSTLLNALFRERMLPARVGPSSNTLILCERDERERACALYRDGRTEVIESDIADQLGNLGDEERNPGNRLGIKEIRLSSPRFMLNSGIVLVDTPGLDAHGLQSHEKLTLDVFLPTVDAVVFVSETKPNSGQKNREYLERIKVAGKPCIYVQNKLDALVPKLGDGGIVVEDVEQVRLKHLRRCKDLVDGVFGENLAHIIQVSARDELEGRPSRSGMDILVASIEERTASLLPALQRGRLTQLQRFLSDVTRQATAASSIEEGQAALREELANARRLRSITEKIKDDFASWIKADARRSRTAAMKLKDELTSLQRTHHTKAAAVKGAIKEWQDRDIDGLCSAIRVHHARASDLAKELNLRDEDFRIPLPARATRNVRLVTETETFFTERKRNWGFCFGWLGRCADSLFGLVREQATRTVFEVEAFRRDATAVIEEHGQWYEHAADGQQHLMCRLLEPLEHEIGRVADSLEAKCKSLLDEAARSQVRKSLRQVKDSLDDQIRRSEVNGSEVPPGRAEGPDLSEEQLIMAAPGYVLDLVAAAEACRRSGFLSLGQVLLARSLDRPDVAAVCVCGWDAVACEEVAFRYFGVATRSDLGDPPKNVAQDGQLCRLVVQRSPPGAVRPAPPLMTFGDGEALPTPSVVFLVLDIDQPGATQSQILRSGILAGLSPDQVRVVAVMQSLQCARVNGPETLAESLHETIIRLAELGLRPSGLIANDRSLDLSLLIDRLYRSGNQLRSQADEVAWVQALEMNSWPDEEASRLGSEMMKHWRLLRRPESGA